MGTYTANQGSDTHRQVQPGGEYDVVDATFRYHYGQAGIDETTLPMIPRFDVVAIRTAAALSQNALDVAIAASPLGVEYAALIAEADVKNVAPMHHPRRAFRAWALSLVDLPAPPTN